MASSTQPRPGLLVRKLADRSTGERIKRYDPETGEAFLLNPATGTREGWPLLGIEFIGDPPAQARIPTSFVSNARGEGWLKVEGEDVVHRPGGPLEDRWRITHTFQHLKVLVFETVNGDVRYRVTRQPDKYVEGNDTAKVTDTHYAEGETVVDWFYDIELES